MKRPAFITVVAVLVAAAFLGVGAYLSRVILPGERKPPEAKTIPIIIDAAPQKVTAYPVQLGVPFEPGEFARLNFTVTKHRYPIPYEATELVGWRGKHSGVKVALVSFLADLGTKPTHGYAITYDLPDMAQKAFVIDVVNRADGGLDVDTGKVSFSVSANPLVLLRNVAVDGKPVVRESVLEVVRADGKRFSKLKNGKVDIEKSGGISAVIEVTGEFDDPAAGGLGILARITAYANKPYVKLDYTLIQRAAAPVLELKGWKLGLVPAGKFERYTIGGDGQDHFGDLDGKTVGLYQDGELTPSDGSLRVVATRMKYTGVGEGKRAPGWARARTQTGEVLAAVRHFWQQYPKAIEVVPGRMDLWLQSPRSEHTFKPLVAGWAKTHEMLIHFDAGADAEADAVRAAFQKGVRATVPAERYRKCGIFGDYSLPSPASRDHDFVTTTFLDYTRFPHVVHFAFQGSGRWWMEGNLTFGSRMVWNYYLNNTRDSAGRLFMHSLRLVESYPAHARYAFDLAEAQARCSMDLHVMHADHTEGAFAGWGAGMVYGHSSYPGAKRVLKTFGAHRRYTHYSGPFEPTRTGSRWGPMIHPAGLMEYYLLTGDLRAKEVLTEIADWAVAFQKNGGRDYTNYVRAADGPTGLYLWTLMSAYEATGRAEYLDALYAAAGELRKTYEKNKGSLVGRWKDATGKGVLLSCLIRLLWFDERFDRLDRAEVTRWIVDTVSVFQKEVRRREDGSARLALRCSGSNRLMYHAFAWVAALPDAPDWAKDDFRDLVTLPAYHTTHPDEERFESIRPGSRDGVINVCSTIEEGTEMWLWNSAETMALAEKVFGEAALPKADDPMNAFYAEYQRACRDDPDSLIALAPEAPEADEMGDFPRIPTCRVAYAKTPPVIDGDPDDACWRDAEPMRDFTLQNRAGPSKLNTTVKLAHDREHLYVVMIAPDLKPPARTDKRDGRQWQEDGIELFLDTNFDRTSYWKIALNLEGEPADDFWVQPFLAVSDWDPRMTLGRKPGVIEIAIPFKEFACRWSAPHVATPEGKWSANVCRMGDGSSWVGHNMALTAHLPQGFGVLTFDAPADE